MHPIPFFDAARYSWQDAKPIRSRPFVCGFCSHRVSSDKGYKLIGVNSQIPDQLAGIFLCPNCGGPTFFTNEKEQLPSPALGNPVSQVPQTLNVLYEEARKCTTMACYTATVLLCRKMLMNIAVSEGAAEGLKFFEYVQFLADNHYVPPKGKHWVDHIRQKGNEATHEIKLMSEGDARDLLNFIEMLLRLIYDFPARIPKPAPSS
jgi:hypothetical protein